MIDAEELNGYVNSLEFIAEKQHFSNAREYYSKIEDLLDDYVGRYTPDIKFSKMEKDYIIENVLEGITFSLDECAKTATEEVLNDKWLENTDIKFEYANRYFNYLSNTKHWDRKVVNVLKKDSFKIIQMLGNPNGDGFMHRKGLLIGDVQSGKTASYTAILNRAVDVGYKIIILLAGTTSVLRQQTQKRLDYELMGSTLNNEHPIVGVGIKKSLNKIFPATSVKKDYSKTASITHPVHVLDNQTIIFVTKKNVSTLKYIKEALENSNTDIRNTINGRIDASLLLVDDEADNASVDTRDKNMDPTAINRSIRDILNLFNKTAYLAVTATPFANIFIDDDLKENFGQDLFPSDFICLLDRSDKYTGARELFGDIDIKPSEKWLKEPKSYADYCINEIQDSEMTTTFRYRHKKDEVDINDFEDLPNSMRYAIRYFVLVQKLMDFLPGVDKHRSMMINVSRFVKVQNDIFTVIGDWLENKLKPQIKKYANYPEKADDKNTGEYYELSCVWKEEDLENKSGISWEEFSPSLISSLSALRVAVVNNGKISKLPGNNLNYDNYPNGDRVIAIGGQCLSRGLTLETLVVSYFYRNSAAYDTLLQMGRWFGYRGPYLRYYRIWMSEQSQRWYSIISEACEDLRDQINTMNDQMLTPSEFGLAVKYHPTTSLIVTARNKMRNVQKADRWVPTDLRTHLIESPRLYADMAENKKNCVLIDNFISKLNQPLSTSDGLVWKDISRDSISSLVKAFNSARLSIGFKVSELAKYIENQTSSNWDVAIIQNSSAKNSSYYKLGQTGIEFSLIDRPCEEDKVNNILRVYGHHVRIGTGGATKVGLSKDTIEGLATYYGTQWAKKKNRASIYLHNIPGVMERNCILILYPLNLYHYKDGKIVKDVSEREYLNNKELPVIWGLGLGFVGEKPATKEDSCYGFYLNPVAQDLGWDFGEEEGDDVGDENNDEDK